MRRQLEPQMMPPQSFRSFACAETLGTAALTANAKTLRAIANTLGVAPLDLLNYASENDDLKPIVESK